MAAPDYAEPIGEPINESEPPPVHCEACGWDGKLADLLGIDPDENTTLWCPKCRSAYWVFV